jgi:hypothetical protein
VLLSLFVSEVEMIVQIAQMPGDVRRMVDRKHLHGFPAREGRRLSRVFDL